MVFHEVDERCVILISGVIMSALLSQWLLSLRLLFYSLAISLALFAKPDLVNRIGFIVDSRFASQYLVSGVLKT